MGDKSFKMGFAENFALSGAAAVISKTAAAPIERVKLLVQNQDEMIKQGKLTEPYKGVIDCTARTFKTEGKVICFAYLTSKHQFSSMPCIFTVLHHFKKHSTFSVI